MSRASRFADLIAEYGKHLVDEVLSVLGRDAEPAVVAKAVARRAKSTEKAAPAKVAGGAPAAKKPGKALPTGRKNEQLRGADDPLMVSTRRPSPAKYAVFGNPDEEMLIQSGDALRLNPETFERNMRQLAEEPFMADAAGLSPDDIYDLAVKRGADNLNFIMTDLMPPERVSAAKEWYPIAQQFSKRAAERAGLPPEAGYGVAAVLSPQTPWDINVARLDRLMDMYGDKFAVDPLAARRFIEQRLAADPAKAGAIAKLGPDFAERIARTPFEEITDPFERFARVSLADATRNSPDVPMPLLTGEYGPRSNTITWGSGDVINKAINIMNDPSMSNINDQLLGGGKVPSFYNNIAAPYSELPITTIDTHSAGATALFPGGGNDPVVFRGMGLGGPQGVPGAISSASTGSKGYYGPLSDAHTLSAKMMGFAHPREVQSATWEGVRDLWGQSGKTPALKKAITDIYRTSSSPDEARFRIAELLGKPVRRMFQVK